MDGRSMTEAEHRQRQQMRPEHEEEILESFRHQLENINIYAKRYGDSMSYYIKNPNDYHVQQIDKARVKVILGLRELKLKQERHPEALTELVTQAVASFEEFVGINSNFEERVEKYKLENNTLKAKIMRLRRRYSNAPKEPEVPDYTSEEIKEYARFGLDLGQNRMGRD